MLTLDAFEAELKAGKVRPAYAGIGNDAWMRRRFLSAIRAAIADGPEGGAAPETIPGKEATPDRIRQALGEGLLFATRRVVIVEDADALVSKPDTLPPPPKGGSVLVLLASKMPPGGRAPAWAVRLSPPDEDALLDWIRRFALEAGAKMPEPSVRALASRTGSDLARAESEIARLSAYAGENGRIEADDVARLVPPDVERSAFDLLKSLNARRGAEALRFLHDLFQHGIEPEAILGALAWQARQTQRIRLLAENGADASEIGSRLRMPPERAAWLVRQAQALPAGEIERRRSALLRADSGLKGSRQGGRGEAILEELLVELGA